MWTYICRVFVREIENETGKYIKDVAISILSLLFVPKMKSLQIWLWTSFIQKLSCTNENWSKRMKHMKLINSFK